MFFSPQNIFLHCKIFFQSGGGPQLQEAAAGQAARAQADCHRPQGDGPTYILVRQHSSSLSLDIRFT